MLKLMGKKNNLEGGEEMKIGGNGHKKLTLKQRLVRYLLKDAHIDELHIGAHSIVIDGDVIKMNALASDPATPAEGWIWFLAGITHKPRHRDNVGNKDIGEGATPGAHAASHQNGGADEVSVAGLSGELADAQPPKTHNLGGAEHGADTLANLNAKVSDATLDDSSASRTPTAHKTTHQSGGGDEVVGILLQGTAVGRPAAGTANRFYLATDTMELSRDNGITWDSIGVLGGLDLTAHVSRHANAGADELSVAGLSGVLADAQTPASHSRTKHSDIDQSLLIADNVAFNQVTVGDLVMKNGYRFTEHKKYGVVFKSPEGKLYRLLVERC